MSGWVCWCHRLPGCKSGPRHSGWRPCAMHPSASWLALSPTQARCACCRVLHASAFPALVSEATTAATETLSVCSDAVGLGDAGLGTGHSSTLCHRVLVVCLFHHAGEAGAGRHGTCERRQPSGRANHNSSRADSASWAPRSGLLSCDSCHLRGLVFPFLTANDSQRGSGACTPSVQLPVGWGQPAAAPQFPLGTPHGLVLPRTAAHMQQLGGVGDAVGAHGHAPAPSCSNCGGYGRCSGAAHGVSRAGAPGQDAVLHGLHGGAGSAAHPWAGAGRPGSSAARDFRQPQRCQRHRRNQGWQRQRCSGIGGCTASQSLFNT